MNDTWQCTTALLLKTVIQSVEARSNKILDSGSLTFRRKSIGQRGQNASDERDRETHRRERNKGCEIWLAALIVFRQVL